MSIIVRDNCRHTYSLRKPISRHWQQFPLIST